MHVVLKAKSGLYVHLILYYTTHHDYIAYPQGLRQMKLYLPKRAITTRCNRLSTLENTL